MPRKKTEQDIQFDVEVGARIEAVRKMRKLTQRHVAAEVGITQQQLYWYECGRTSCPSAVLVRLAAALWVPVGRFLES